MMLHQLHNLCYDMEKNCELGGGGERDVWGEGNVWEKCFGENVWKENSDGGKCRGKLSGEGEKNVGISKINYHLLESHKQLKFVIQSSSC